MRLSRSLRYLRSASLPKNTRCSSTSAKDRLQGSVSPHERHLVLFTGRDYETLPSHIDTVSPLYRAIAERTKESSSPLSKYALAITDATAQHTNKSSLAWDKNQNRFDRTAAQTDLEEYGAVIYPDRREIPFALSLDSLASGQLETFCNSLPLASRSTNAGLDVFICTHGVRDCRCGDVGTAFFDALVKEARRKRVGGKVTAFNEDSGPIRIHRTTHIGGHRYAATCFTSTGDWYGLLSPTDASTFLEHLLRQHEGPTTNAFIWWDKWRGRAGLSQAQQLELAESAQAEAKASKEGGSALDMLQTLKKQRKRRESPLGDAFDVTFATYDGELNKVRAFVGETLMDVAKRHDLVEATCGGACECATCHVHISPIAGVLPPLADVVDEEEDQLEFAIGADDYSRLACQIQITEELKDWLEQGGQVKLPRY